MKRIPVACFHWMLIVLVFPLAVSGQPYFDAAGLTSWYMLPDAQSDNVTEAECLAFVSIPVSIAKNNKLIFSPFYETRFLDNGADKKTERTQSATLPVTWLHFTPDSTWSFTATVFSRFNSTQLRFNGDVFQIAGAVIGTRRINTKVKLKAGLYYSREFFGDYFIPLAGIDWTVNDRLNVFAILPSFIKVEYHLWKPVYTGVNFRSITNSYRQGGGAAYYRVDDNHVCWYADFYLTKHVVWSVDAGHTILRTIKSREGAQFPEVNDENFIFKTGLFYRIRLD